jgi:hypothetical protein
LFSCPHTPMCVLRAHMYRVVVNKKKSSPVSPCIVCFHSLPMRFVHLPPLYVRNGRLPAAKRVFKMLSSSIYFFFTTTSSSTSPTFAGPPTAAVERHQRNARERGSLEEQAPKRKERQ